MQGLYFNLHCSTTASFVKDDLKGLFSNKVTWDHSCYLSISKPAIRAHHDPQLLPATHDHCAQTRSGPAAFSQSCWDFTVRETCMLENEKGLSPLIKMQPSFSVAFMTLERRRRGVQGRKWWSVSLYRSAEIAQVSVGSPGNYSLRGLLTCSSPSNSTNSFEIMKQDLLNSLYFPHFMTVFLYLWPQNSNSISKIITSVTDCYRAYYLIEISLTSSPTALTYQIQSTPFKF